MQNLIATLHFEEKKNALVFLQNDGVFMIVPEGENKGAMFWFRGGTRDFGKLNLGYIHQVVAPLAIKLNMVFVCPEYGSDDLHGGETDLKRCDKALEDLKKLGLPYMGALGESRGCLQAWKMHQRHPELQDKPIVMWCPVFDYETWLKERPGVADLFKELGITDLDSRSASKQPDLAAYASKYLVLGAIKDERVLPHHAASFVMPNVEYHELDDAHCFPNEREKALTLTIDFLKKA